MSSPVLTLMSRKACCLCDEAARLISQLVDQGLCSLNVVDVDEDIRLAACYGMDVPVLLFQDEVLMKHRIDMDQLTKHLKEFTS